MKQAAKEAMDAAKEAAKKAKDFEKEMQAEEWFGEKAKKAVKAKNLKKAQEIPAIENTKVTSGFQNRKCLRRQALPRMELLQDYGLKRTQELNNDK